MAGPTGKIATWVHGTGCVNVNIQYLANADYWPSFTLTFVFPLIPCYKCVNRLGAKYTVSNRESDLGTCPFRTSKLYIYGMLPLQNTKKAVVILLRDDIQMYFPYISRTV
jgi:hypothetical protein